MADTKISGLPSATTPLAGTELVPIVQGGTTKQTTVQGVLGGMSTDGTNVSVSHSQNVGISSAVINSNAGTAAQAILKVDNGTKSMSFAMPGTGFTTAGNFVANRGYVYCNSDIVFIADSSVMRWSTGGYTTTQLTLDTSGNLTANTGNLVIGTSGKGIDFSATSDASGMTSELLADYEEGTWTPVIADASTGGNTGTASSVAGVYRKIGNLVHINGTLVNIDTTGMTAGNSLYIRGFPYTTLSNATLASFSGVVYANNLTISTGGTLIVDADDAGTWCILRVVYSAASADTITVSDVSSGVTDLRFSITYAV